MYKINWFTILAQFLKYFFVILKGETCDFVLHLRDFILEYFVLGDFVQWDFFPDTDMMICSVKLVLHGMKQRCHSM